ncbi:MAG: primosomal protein N' [Hyphomonadaceae bacterium]|nr:primosomal protein N' [Hyphomonadaceae bacterium]
MPARIAKVLFPVNLRNAFDYAVPAGMNVAAGDFVYAPLGKHVRLGVVFTVGDDSEYTSLKELLQVKATTPLPKLMLDFIDWTARYNCAAKGMVLRMVMRSRQALDPGAEATFYMPTGVRPKRMTSSRQAVFDKGGPFPSRLSGITSRAGVSAGVVKGLVECGAMVSQRRPVDAPFAPPDPALPPIDLTPKQREIADGLAASVRAGGFTAALLDGVTGSGKTEVYFEAVAEVLESGGQALILVPEIALTQAALKRVSNRFGAYPATWHSSLTDVERRRAWREVAQGRARLVVGARSALYLPFADLRLIVVDEEHDTSYKQEEGVIYNARDMSVVRAMLGRHAVILASATPSLESLMNARRGHYSHYVLPERPGAVTLPPVELVDLKEYKPERSRYLSGPLIHAVNNSLANGEQALLYLNRRGYAPHIICNVCGERLRSPDTDSWLVEHRRTGRAVCHHTGFSMKMPEACPKCESEDSLVGVGPGVERIAEEAALRFPNANIEILSSDTAGNPAEIRTLMARMESGEIDIMVGTQMVVKGHNFPRLTFVGVIDGDLGLGGGDLRAGERTYQTLVQVAGRAGRADRAGHALIQTHHPEHAAFAALAAGDRDLFIEAELTMREAFELPPFGKLAAVIVSGPELQTVETLAGDCVHRALRIKGIDIMGPSEPPIARLRGNHRRRMLVQSAANINLSKYMQDWLGEIKPPGKYKIHIDIDPWSFM